MSRKRKPPDQDQQRRPGTAIQGLPPQASRWPMVVTALVSLIVGGILVERWTRPKDLPEPAPPVSADRQGKEAEGADEAAEAGPVTVEGLVDEVQQIAADLERAYPDRPAALALVGRIHQRLGNTAKAEQCWQQCLKTAPSAEVRFQVGAAAWQRGDFRAAARHLEEALDANPHLPNAHVFLAESLMNLGRPEDAVRTLERHAEATAASPQALFLLGQSALQAKDYPKARAALEAALRLDADFANAHFALANALVRLDQPQEAKYHREIFSKLKARIPGHEAGRRAALPERELLEKRMMAAELSYEAGRVCRGEGDAATARKYWLRAVALQPDNPVYRQAMDTSGPIPGRAPPGDGVPR